MSVNSVPAGGESEDGEGANSSNSTSNGGRQNDYVNIAQNFSNILLQNSPAVQQVLQQCRGVDGSCNMYCLMECLVKSPAIRDCLRQTTFHVQLPNNTPVVTAAGPYGAKLVHRVLFQEEYFSLFRLAYYLLYQSFPPNPRMGLAVITQRYAVSKKFEVEVLQQLNSRICNQSILNYLLIELRQDKNVAKFWDTVITMIQYPALKACMDRYRLQHVNKLCVQDVMSTKSDGNQYECIGAAATDTESPSECDDIADHVNTEVNMSLHRRYYRLYQRTDLDSNTVNMMTTPAGNHLLELMRSDKEQDNEAEIDRLVDGGDLSYYDMAEACLTKRRINNQPLLNTNTAFGVDLHPSYIINCWEQRGTKPITLAVVKKYYDLMLESLPNDYMATLEFIYLKYPHQVPSGTIEYITAPQNIREVKQRLLDLFLHSMLYEDNPDVNTMVISILMVTMDLKNHQDLKKIGDELITAIFDDKYNLEVTKLHKFKAGNMSTSNTAMASPHVQSPTMSGDHDKSWTAVAQTNTSDTDPNRHGVQHSWTKNKLYRSYSSDHSITCNVHLQKLGPKTCAVIKKYYDQIWKSFPKDYMVSLERYCGVWKLAESTIEYIAEAETADLANQRLLNMMTCVIDHRHEDTLFHFVNNIEVVIGNSNVMGIIEQLRNDLVEAIIEEANSRTPVSPSDPLGDSTDPQPVSLTSQISNSGSDVVHTSGVEETNDDGYFDLINDLMLSMPEDYKKTISEIQQYLTVDEISKILASPDFMTANQAIIKCLMTHMTHGQQLMTFCNILESIKDAPALAVVIKRLREYISVKMYGKTGVDHVTSSGKPASTSSTDLFTPAVFTVLESRAKPELLAVLRKYYDSLLNSFPQDPRVTHQRIHTSSIPISPSPPHQSTEVNPLAVNRAILDNFIIMVALSPEENASSVFCMVMSIIIGNTDITRNLEMDLLKAVKGKDNMASVVPLLPMLGSLSQHPLATVTSHYNEKDREASLSSFDDHYDLMIKINPRFAKEKFLLSFKFPIGDPLTGNLTLQPNEIQMEVLLAFVRNSIGSNGAKDFLKLVDILCSQEPYSDIGVYLLDTYHSKGGHGMPTVHCHKFGDCLSFVHLTKKLEHHSKQLLAGIQYQPPKPLPQYYVLRPHLLERLTYAILVSDSTSIDVDVCLASMNGYGKSTLVKAVCYQKDILEYFLDGFLWIKLGAMSQDPVIKLKNLYRQLTAKTFTGDPDFLIEKLKNLAINHLHKLLVIIDDVWKPDDVYVYVEIFRHCKIILLTCKPDLNSYFPSSHFIKMSLINTNIETSLKFLTMQVEGFEIPTAEQIAQLKGLAEDVYHWPVLLSIVHCQLILYCNKQKMSPNVALQKVMQKLLKVGHVDDTKGQGFNAEIKPVIETSLEFLEGEDISRLNQLAHLGNEGTYKKLLPHFWNVTEAVAEDCVERLLSCGLVQYNEELFLTESSYSVVPSVEVHTLVAQYLLSRTYHTPLDISYV
ncbi:uncharacterized protein [Dysidea avara]|uniref:uncharacterized protein isoform X2 n=1 Tax=Dysidea avara TaxID=196820 RepID=UPI00331CD8F4